MMTTLPPLAEAYIRSTNSKDPAAFLGLFAHNAQVNDNGREYRGLDAIKEWSEREIFAAQVTLEVINYVARNGEAVISTVVEGNFDRTGLPNPVVIDHHITAQGDKIIGLACRLSGANL